MDIEIEGITITNIFLKCCGCWPLKEGYKFSLQLENGQTLHICKDKIYIEKYIPDFDGEGKYYNGIMDGYIIPIMEYNLNEDDFEFENEI